MPIRLEGGGCLFPIGVKQPIVTGFTPHLGKCREVRGPPIDVLEVLRGFVICI
jgi:hypothetical protein